MKTRTLIEKRIAENRVDVIEEYLKIEYSIFYTYFKRKFESTLKLNIKYGAHCMLTNFKTECFLK